MVERALVCAGIALVTLACGTGIWTIAAGHPMYLFALAAAVVVAGNGLTVSGAWYLQSARYESSRPPRIWPIAYRYAISASCVLLVVLGLLRLNQG